jgi:archaellum component FlaG (FlaF/FlaG flagellin family)
MAVFTNAISSSASSGVLQLSGTIETAGFISALGLGNASVINHPTTIPRDYNSLLYGPITIKHTGSLMISSGAAIKIKDLEDV